MNKKFRIPLLLDQEQVSRNEAGGCIRGKCMRVVVTRRNTLTAVKYILLR
jgi:hypothetical protein